MVDRYLSIGIKNLNIEDNPKTGCWVLDYVPDFKNLILSKNVIKKVKKYLMIDETERLDTPINLAICGASGSGKWTIIRTIIRHYYKIDLNNVRLSKIDNEDYPYVKSYSTISNIIYYVNLEVLKQVEIRDLMEYIKGKIENSNSQRILIIRHANLFDEQQQRVLGYWMEKYGRRMLFIITYNHGTQISGKMGVLCFRTRNEPFHSIEEFSISFKQLLKQWKVSRKMKIEVGWHIYQKNNCNLRNTILQIQDSIQNHEGVYVMPIEESMMINILNLASEFKSENLSKLRDMLYSVMATKVPPNIIIRRTLALVMRVPTITSEKKCKIVEFAGEASADIVNSDRPIFALEKFFYNLSSVLN